MGDVGDGVFQEFFCVVFGFLAGFQGGGHVVDAAEQTVEGAFPGLGQEGVEISCGVSGDGFDGFLLEAVLEEEVAEEGG